MSKIYLYAPELLHASFKNNNNVPLKSTSNYIKGTKESPQNVVVRK
jgi:hypothetical protein